MAKEYIERGALRNAFLKSKNTNTHHIAEARFIHVQEHNHILNLLEKTPVADVVEVVPGRWIETNWAERDGHGEVITHYETTALKCSNCCCCFKKESLWRRNYCPNCGAKMDGKENEDA